MAAGADTEKQVGLAHSQIVEKDIRHIGIVVLAGMQQQMANRWKRHERLAHWGGLHEVRARPDYRDYCIH